MAVAESIVGVAGKVLNKFVNLIEKEKKTIAPAAERACNLFSKSAPNSRERYVNMANCLGP